MCVCIVASRISFCGVLSYLCRSLPWRSGSGGGRETGMSVGEGGGKFCGVLRRGRGRGDKKQGVLGEVERGERNQKKSLERERKEER